MTTIRYGTSRDFKQIFRLYRQVRPDAETYRTLLFDLYNRSIICEGRFYLCAFEDGGETMIGYCAVNFHTSLRYHGYIASVYEIIIDKHYQRHGIGKDLCSEAIALAKDAGCNSIEFFTGYFKEQSHSFYKKMGFMRSRSDVYSKVLDPER
jgi:ribosomal protein S18 acetylase RimI-like enzyme